MCYAEHSQFRETLFHTDSNQSVMQILLISFSGETSLREGEVSEIWPVGIWLDCKSAGSLHLLCISWQFKKMLQKMILSEN